MAPEASEEVSKVLQSGYITQGPKVEEFEGQNARVPRKRVYADDEQRDERDAYGFSFTEKATGRVAGSSTG